MDHFEPDVEAGAQFFRCAGGWIEFLKSVSRPDQQVPTLLTVTFTHRIEGIIPQAKMYEAAAHGVMLVESCSSGGKPEATGTVFIYVGDRCVGKIASKPASHSVKAVDLSTDRPKPECTRSVFEQERDIIEGDGGGIERILPVDREIVSVESVQPIWGSKPHESFAVLEDAEHTVVRQPLFNREVPEFNFSCLRLNRPLEEKSDCERNARQCDAGRHDSHADFAGTFETIVVKDY